MNQTHYLHLGHYFQSEAKFHLMSKRNLLVESPKDARVRHSLSDPKNSIHYYFRLEVESGVYQRKWR